MDAIRSSGERNHSSSSLGTTTRSRSQLFFHRSRSGLLRPDPARRHKPYAELPLSRRGRRHRSSESSDNSDDVVLAKYLCKKTKPNPEASSSAGDDDELSRVLMKDLRARRVYSPQSSAGGCTGLATDVFSKASGADSDCGARRIADVGFGLKPSVENGGCDKEGSKVEGESDNMGKVLSSEDQKKNDEVNSVLSLVLNEYRSDMDSDLYADDVTGSSELGLSPKAPNSDPGNTESLDESSKLRDVKQIFGISSDKDDGSTEELPQTTPPDAEICFNSVVKGDEGKQAVEVTVTDVPFAGNAVENAREVVVPKDGQRNDSVPKGKSVLRPRLPGKLFKTPGSVSFKRLFPYLKNIMGVDSGMTNLGRCCKDEKGVDGHESQLPLSSHSHKASNHQHKSETYSLNDTCQSAVSEGDAAVTPVHELSHGNGSNLESSCYLLESPMELHTEEVMSELSSVPSMKYQCLSKSRADSVTDFHGAKEVGNAVCNDDLKQDSKHDNNPDYMKATDHGDCNSEQFGVLNEECIQATPPDTEVCDKSEVKLESDPPDICNVKVMDTGRSNQDHVGEDCRLKTDNRKDSVVRSQSVPRSNLHRKLFKNPGSVNYNRLLPFLMDYARDEYGHQTDHTKDEVDMKVKRLPLSSQSKEASFTEHKTDSGPLHGTVESNPLVNNTLVDPTVEISPSNQPKLTPSQDLPEVVHECLSSPAVNEHVDKVEMGSIDKCLRDSKCDPSSVMVDFHCVDSIPIALHSDAFEQGQNKKSREHNSESPPKAQNLLCIDSNISDLTFEHHPSKEKGFFVDFNEGKEYVSVEEKCESVSRYLPEGQSLNNLNPNLPDAEDNEKSSRAICRSDDAVALNHVNVSNEESRPSSEKIILENSDIAGHVHEGGSVLKGKVYGPRLPSKGSSNKTATRIGRHGSSSESNETLVINRCSRTKLLKHTGSLNYKRMLPYILNTVKDNSCASANDHCLKVQKCLDQAPLLPVSDSDMRATPICGSTGCFPMENCRGSSGTKQQTGLHDCVSNDDRPIPKSEVPESQPSNDSWKVIQLQGEQVESNGSCKMESSEEARPLGPMVNGAITREEATYALTVTPRISAIGFKKGILKRNPRGCRGLCTCLTCASFRLHAERAFEFSRNQFLDAEEVAQDLIKELSHLRNILERSSDSVSANPVSDGNQVKEACRKAFVTEQLARDRFSHMSDDLRTHCRISNLRPPRVTFSDHVEEKVFQPDR